MGIERFKSLRSVAEALSALGVLIDADWLAVIAKVGRQEFLTLLDAATEQKPTEAAAIKAWGQALDSTITEPAMRDLHLEPETLVKMLLTHPIRTASALQIYAVPTHERRSDAAAYLSTAKTRVGAVEAQNSQPSVTPAGNNQKPLPATMGTERAASDKTYSSRHVYGSSSALCFNLSTYRGKAGIMIDAAVAVGGDYNWDDAIHLWLTETEIAACFAVLRKWHPRIELGNHGAKRDKSLLIETQGAHVFVRVGERSRQVNGLRAVKMLPGDATAVAIFLMDALKACYPGVPLQEIVETIRCNYQSIHPAVVNG